MKWICFLLLFIVSHKTIAQESRDSTFLPDTLYSVGVSSFFQKEDIFNYLTFQAPIIPNLLLEIGVGFGWRQARTSSALQLGYQVAFHYDLLKRPKLNLGPSLRLGYVGTNPNKEEFTKFNYYTANLGYRFAYGGKLKVVQSSYIGPHQMWYKTESGKKGVVYFGYAFQFGLNYEF